MNLTRTKILLIEDNPGDARLIQALLREVATLSVEFVQVEWLESGLQRLGQEPFDLVLLDLDLPDSRGFDTFLRIKEEEPGVPIIVLTGLDDDLLALRALREGAQDYLVKGQFESKLLGRAIHYALERYRLRRELIHQTSALLHSESRFHHMIEHNLDSIVIVDNGGRIRFVNPAAELLFGCPAHELIDQSFGFPLVAGEKSELELVHSGQPEAATIVEMQVAETSWGDQPAYLCSLRDITERKRAEAQLHYQANILRNVSDAVIATDLNYVVESWNPGAEEVYGWSAEEAISRPTIELLQPQYSDEPREQIIAQFLETGFWRGETIHRRKDGAPIPILASVSMIRDMAGKPVGAVAVNRDISERKRMEEALREYSERLEEMVEERTKALVRQEKLAVLGQLAGGVAHDLRNPLGAIKNALYYLKATLPNAEPDVQEVLAIANKELDKAQRIIYSLLDFARTRPPNRCLLDINDLLRATWSNLPAPAADIEVEWQLDKTLPQIWADPTQLGQVFTNLMGNAIQAMPEGGRLVIKSERAEANGVTVAITDSGVGIPPENLPRLFEPLFTTKPKGIGLGLALVKNLVEGHGGTIEVESVMGQGSAFTVRLGKGKDNGNG